ncbi:D-alanyl-D-alanine carboxypeptidase [Candidatus Syntrophocurvum alkaliphilum]|uniref:serine-type D-Ala-D-Ala carboxypeptidase n=1 Tax=Candidatus Syntrophocurvum alkaliphilum TaxID=2293317 RepID=A0A6I6DEY6_9FIRM|nr:D-alanyl-D-alanine carboxypeptidase family protein [Candidatus Syntrophocurvum alkaliphilum]QGT99222.1 D-alanyl-D-alanine carboxypeptidase [Candidatus Syntrophocurvum alkaliphilum]
MRYILKLFLSVCILFLIQVTSVSAEPNVSSQYFCLVDKKSGQVLYEKNMDEQRPVASTTKIMTAILTMEYMNLSEIATVSAKADRTPEVTIGLREGQELTVGELLKVTLIRSANDAAVVLAEHIAGDEDFFGELMTRKAIALGAFNTQFKNASGLPNKEHFSTAYDLSIISRYALKHDYIKETVKKEKAEFKHPGYSKPITIKNTNTLLGSFPGADGIKTGTTNAAGKCLVASATRDQHQLITVVLRSPDRKGDSARLLSYGFNNFYLEKIVDNQQPFKEAIVIGGTENYVEVIPNDEIYIWSSGSLKNIEKKTIMKYSLEAPVSYGNKVGFLEVYAYDKKLAKVDLVAKNDIEQEKNVLLRILSSFF